MGLYSNRSQKTSKCSRNISEVICDLLHDRHPATWNLFVNYVISWIKRTFSLVLTYDELEERRLDEGFKWLYMTPD